MKNLLDLHQEKEHPSGKHPTVIVRTIRGDGRDQRNCGVDNGHKVGVVR